MKLYPSILFLILTSTQSNAQHSVLSTSDTRRLFIGMKNTIDIAVPGMDCDSISLESSLCQITGQGCTYKVEPYKPGLITLNIIKRNNHQILDSFKIPCGTLPDPLIKLADYAHDRSFLLRQGPRVFTNPTGLNLELKIIDFDLRIQRGDTTIYSGKNSGMSYTKKSLEVLDKMKANDTLIVENVRIEGGDNLHWTLDGQAAVYVVY